MRKSILANLISIAGLILIGFSCYWLTDKELFPGYLALVPTIGAGLIIYAGHISHHSVFNRLLATKLFVGIGLISYSLYIWHWPIVAFWHYYNPGINISFFSGLLLLLITVLLSVTSYFIIELPIKHKRYNFKSALIKFQLIPLMFVVITSVVIVKTRGIPSRLNHDAQIQSLFLSDEYCHNEINGSCIFGDKSQLPTRVILFGDSHAGSLSPFWSKIAESYNFSLKIISTDSCYPLLNTKNNLPSSNSNLYSPVKCSNQIRYISEHVDDYSVFILASAWNSYFNSNEKITRFNFEQELNNTLTFLQQRGKKVIIMRDVPFVSNNGRVPMILRRDNSPWPLNAKDKLLQMDNNETMNNRLQKIVSRYPNVYYFDIVTNVTSHVKSFPYFNHLLLYIDHSHLNQYGSTVLAQEYLSSSNALHLKQLLESCGISNESVAK